MASEDSVASESFRAACGQCDWRGDLRSTYGSAQADARVHTAETGHKFDFDASQDADERAGMIDRKKDHDCAKESGVEFPDGAMQLDPYEVRRRYPRKTCPKCKAICYASYAHYIAGDW